MNINMTIRCALILLYLFVGSVAAAYIAAIAFFLVNKTMPNELAIDTWYLYWNAYSRDPVQHKRLIASGIASLAIVYGVPLLLLAKHRATRRSLHGDARWATESEIRKAGLL